MLPQRPLPGPWHARTHAQGWSRGATRSGRLASERRTRWCRQLRRWGLILSVPTNMLAMTDEQAAEQAGLGSTARFQLPSRCRGVSMWLERCVVQSTALTCWCREAQPALHCKLAAHRCIESSTVCFRPPHLLAHLAAACGSEAPAPLMQHSSYWCLPPAHALH